MSDKKTFQKVEELHERLIRLALRLGGREGRSKKYQDLIDIIQDLGKWVMRYRPQDEEEK